MFSYISSYINLTTVITVIRNVVEAKPSYISLHSIINTIEASINTPASISNSVKFIAELVPSSSTLKTISKIAASTSLVTLASSYLFKDSHKQLLRNNLEDEKNFQALALTHQKIIEELEPKTQELNEKIERLNITINENNLLADTLNEEITNTVEDFEDSLHTAQEIEIRTLKLVNSKLENEKAILTTNNKNLNNKLKEANTLLMKIKQKTT